MVPRGIAAPEAKQLVFQGHGNAVGERSWQGTSLLPGGAGLFQHPNPVVPDFSPALPWHFVREIGPARHQQRPAGDASEGRRYPRRVWQGSQPGP
jgi:hypothetical protein